MSASSGLSLMPRLMAASAVGTLAALAIAGGALAHPESEGEHPSGCVVTVTPDRVAVGGSFTVAGNFGAGAEIYVVKGADGQLAEDATPVTTIASGTSFSVTLVAEQGDVGELTIFGLLPESECGDSDGVTVTAASVPNVATDRPQPVAPIAVIGALLLVAGLAAALRRGHVVARVG